MVHWRTETSFSTPYTNKAAGHDHHLSTPPTLTPAPLSRRLFPSESSRSIQAGSGYRDPSTPKTTPHSMGRRRFSYRRLSFGRSYQATSHFSGYGSSPAPRPPLRSTSPRFCPDRNILSAERGAIVRIMATSAVGYATFRRGHSFLLRSSFRSFFSFPLVFPFLSFLASKTPS